MIGGGLVALGLQQGKRYAGLQAEHSDIKSDLEGMARVRPFPNQENLEEPVSYTHLPLPTICSV